MEFDFQTNAVPSPGLVSRYGWCRVFGFGAGRPARGGQRRNRPSLPASDTQEGKCKRRNPALFAFDGDCGGLRQIFNSHGSEIKVLPGTLAQPETGPDPRGNPSIPGTTLLQGVRNHKRTPHLYAHPVNALEKGSPRCACFGSREGRGKVGAHGGTAGSLSQSTTSVGEREKTSGEMETTTCDLGPKLTANGQGTPTQSLIGTLQEMVVKVKLDSVAKLPPG